MSQNNPRLGILLMIIAMIIFAAQDGISRYLADKYNVLMVVMIRYWFFAAFVIFWARAQKGSIRAVAKTKQPILQFSRGLILIIEINVMIMGFVYLGLVEGLAIFMAYPLIVAALSGPILGEAVGWRRWAAIFVGFLGMLIILKPGVSAFSVYALFPMCSAMLFALYSLLTRFAARKDDAVTSFFWTGVVGAFAITLVGVWQWEKMENFDYYWMLLLSIFGVLGHFMLIKCYELAEASTLQPFAYFHLVFGAFIGITLFSEVVETSTAIGTIIVIGAGLFTLFRERRAKAN